MATKKARLKNSNGDYIIPYVPVDSELSSTSENPIQNKAVNTALSSYVPVARKVNGKALNSDITLTASDVNALPSSTTIPTDTNDLTNGAGYITSSALPGVATASTAGLVKPDGTTITINSNGTISAPGGGGGSYTAGTGIDITNDVISVDGSTTNEIDTEVVSEATLATVATTGAFSDLTGTSGVQMTSNLVTSVSSSSTDSQYPSAKLFYDTIGNIETLLSQI